MRTYCAGSRLSVSVAVVSVAAVATIVAAVAAVVPPVFTSVTATVNPVGDNDGPADGGGGSAPASCC